MAFEQTWRWFGPNDPVSLKEIKQTGAAGIVTALHQIPVGEVWGVEEILKRKSLIEDEGLSWSVVESVPVHENIKKRKDNYQQLIDNYKQTLINLGRCGIDTVCYNFMPVLDWSRTNLKVVFRDGSITTRFESKVFTAFDLFILKRESAEKDYTSQEIESAGEYYNSLSEDEKLNLQKTVLLGLPGSLQEYSLDEFRGALKEYNDIGESRLREHLLLFIEEIVPVAEEHGIYLALHPDDPPFPLLGLPRVVKDAHDLAKVTGCADTPNNGITLCTGSLGAGYNNDIVEISEKFAHRVNFVHLRNVSRSRNGDFMEEDHLDGDVDIYAVMKTLLLEQKKRIGEGRKDYRMPMRPDHGRLMIPEMNKEGIYPGYSLFGRMRGLAELRGLELGIIRSLNL